MYANDPLSRFHRAQTFDYNVALTEIQLGRKRSHWMWYIFPQLRALGRSQFSLYYGIADIREARAYLQDPVLGPRLMEICQALLELTACDPLEVLGYPDNLKLRSCMTLFREADPSIGVFQDVLNKFYAGAPCTRTLHILAAQNG